MKNALDKYIYPIIFVLAIIVNIFRFFHLENIPYGFHVDEYVTSVGVKCMATEGTGPWGEKHPIFMGRGYGSPMPPNFYAMAYVWSKIFGYSVVSFRYLSVVVFSFGLWGIFLWVRRVSGVKVAAWALLAASISPWVWVESHLAYESLYAAVFIVWGLYFFWKQGHWFNYLLAGLCFCSSMYFYPVARLFIPLMLVPLFLISLDWKIKARCWLALTLALVIPLIPLIQGVLSGALQTRFNDISIASPAYLQSKGLPVTGWVILGEFINSYLTHFTATFLFLKGDPSYVHSTGRLGILSWLDVGALLLCLWLFFSKRDFRVKQGFLVLFCAVNVALAMVPSGLTNSEIPNALRTSVGWPFLSMIVGIVIVEASERIALINPLSLIVSLIFTGQLLFVYFFVYPNEGKGMFTFWVKEQFASVKNDEDMLKFMVANYKLDYHIRYYLMNNKGQGCKESYQTWLNVGNFMKQAGINTGR